MKKIMVMMIAVLFLMTAVSAQTIVAGKVYNADYSDIVEGANVTVTCTHSNEDTTKSVLSLEDGRYSVQFSENECYLGDSINVYGFKEGVGAGVGDGNSINVDMAPLDIALGVSNIALIPEFGLFIAGLTIVSAIGIFFFVRRK